MVELTIALHRVFNTPQDKFVFDVSHQGYVHKLFTGRRERFDTIRQYEGLNGFLLRSESPHDSYGAGHAGTALSAALGMAVGARHLGGDENVICVAGDAAFTCGVSYEALNNAADNKKPDRRPQRQRVEHRSERRRHRALLQSQRAQLYTGLHDRAAKLVERLLGKKEDFAHRVETGVKGLIAPSVFFEDLGFRYYGPIDGHDLPLLIDVLEFLKEQDEPVILHIKR